MTSENWLEARHSDIEELRKEFLMPTVANNTGLTKIRRERDERRIVWVSDLHIPFHNIGAVEKMVDQEGGADYLIVGGDLLDCYGVSAFKKNKTVPLRLEYLEALRLVQLFSQNFRKVLLLKGNHECFDRETKCLTREKGWVDYPELEEGMNVLSLNKQNTTEWVPIKKVIKAHHEGKMLKVKTGDIDMCVTPNHRIMHLSSDGKEQFFTKASEFTDTPGVIHIPAGITDDGNHILVTSITKGFKHHAEEIDYDDMIWCVQVPNENLFVMRGDKCYFSGNSRVDRIIEEKIPAEAQFLFRHSILDRLAGGEIIDEDGSVSDILEFDNVFAIGGTPETRWYTRIGNTVFSHPTKYLKHEGRTAEYMLQFFRDKMEGIDSVVVGHIHKLGRHYAHGRLCVEGGCMCLPLEYAQHAHAKYSPVPNGYAVIVQDKNGNTDFNRSREVFMGIIQHEKEAIEFDGE